MSNVCDNCINCNCMKCPIFSHEVYGLCRFCPWISHTKLLAKYHRATVQEERQNKKDIVATVSGTGIESETRTFQSTTRSLSELKEWLLALGVTHVSKESTGVYWKPVMNNPTASCRYNPRANLSLCLKTNYKHEVLEISTSQLFF